MNLVILTGNLGADAELKVTATGQSILKFSLATSAKFKNKNGDPEERTEWHRCTLFGERAGNLAKYLTKGTKITALGEIRTSSYEKDGEKRYSTEIIVNQVEFVGGKRDDEKRPAAVEVDPWDRQ